MKGKGESLRKKWAKCKKLKKAKEGLRERTQKWVILQTDKKKE